MQKELVDSLLAKLDDHDRLMTLEELRYLKSVFDSFEGRLYIEEKLISAIESATDTPGDYDFDALYAQIERRIKGRNKRRIPLGRALRIGAVAALLLSIASGVWLYRGHDASGSPAAIARIEDNVRLTMPDGSEIVLDNSTENTRITENITREDGSLIVEKAGMPNDREQMYTSLNVPRGSRFDMVLEDGTHVWLNADSRLRFPTVFPDRERRIRLEGEAWFEVAADAARPFIVETEGQEVRVLGTSFNISAYRDEAVTYTTLVEGSIVLRSDAGAEVTLIPGQQARITAGEAAFTTVEAKAFTPWKDGIFVFEGNTLGQTMRQLARWYDMEYTFADRQAEELVLRGMMPVQTDIASIFDILEASGKVHFSTEGNKVTIRSTK